jgi:hypothetical protein
MGEMSKMTDRMVLQRHVGGFLAFPVCGVGFNLHDLRFFPTYFVAAFIRMLQQTLGQVIFVLLNAYFYRSACFVNVTSATITWDTVHTLLRLLGRMIMMT